MNKKAILALELLLVLLIILGRTTACICLLTVLVVYCTNQIAWLKDKE